MAEKRYFAASSVSYSYPSISPGGAVDPTFFEASQGPVRRAAANLRRVRRGLIADRTALGSDFTAEEVRRQVTLTATSQSDAVKITATSARPERAASLANTYAREYLSIRREATRQKVEAARLLAQNQLDLFPRRLRRRDPSATLLQARVRQLDGLSAPAGGQLSTVTAATTDSLPNVLRSTVLGGLLGVIVGLLAVGLLEFRTRNGLRGLSIPPSKLAAQRS